MASAKDPAGKKGDEREADPHAVPRKEASSGGPSGSGSSVEDLLGRLNLEEEEDAGFVSEDEVKEPDVKAKWLAIAKNKVMKQGPWVFRNQTVMIEEYDGFSNPRSVVLDKITVWAQVLKLPDMLLKEPVIRDIIGKFDNGTTVDGKNVETTPGKDPTSKENKSG
ncbi:hypothetical protein QYE76_037686 [Lolium multiflorum]|uniref:DUF4283 domain-containing protein n=1 Tax=Lolium multiflorum TaxID=4521 RepID=A0AAD8VBN0_LOLMU|nr:hypothetical protein QYE76_037686 [Lolium multiflorum]